MAGHHGVPQSVALVYRVVGNTHVFSSNGIKGLVHVGSHDREKAFHSVMGALNKHVTHVYGCEATYRCEMSYDQFVKHVDAQDDITGNFFEVVLDQAA
jgi:hypothetical protein